MVSQGSQFGSFSPAASASNGPSNHSRAFGKLRVEIARDLRADFVAAAADAGAERGDHVLGLRAEFHVHAPESFRGDAAERAAPSGVNRGDGAPLRIGEKDGNAVRGLHHEQQAGLAREERVALGRVLRAGVRRIHAMRDVGVNLAQRDGAQFVRADRAIEFSAIFEHARAGVPVGEAEIQDALALGSSAARPAEASSLAPPGRVLNPWTSQSSLRERGRFEDLQARGAAQLPFAA